MRNRLVSFWLILAVLLLLSAPSRAQPQDLAEAVAEEEPVVVDEPESSKVFTPQGPAAQPTLRPAEKKSTTLSQYAQVMVFLFTLAGVAYYLIRRSKYGRQVLSKGALKGSRITVMDTKSLGNRQYLSVVSVDGKELLLGVTTQEITLLTELAEEE